MNDKKIKYLREVRIHVQNVQSYLNKFSEDLTRRGIFHDNSKFFDPELSGFSENIDNIPNMIYDSEEYKTKFKEMKSIIDIHHKENRHHPEYWKQGINDMSLSDIIEMLSDWKAASMRYKEGDFLKSIEINCKKYNISPQLKSIILNSIRDGII